MARAAGTGAQAAPVVTATAKRRPRAATAPRKRVKVVVPLPRLVEDDTEVLAAEHAARDAQLLDLLTRLSA